MAAAPNFTAILDRIREVLTDGATVTRRGIQAGQFRWSPGRDDPRDMPASMGDTPTVGVELPDLADSEGTPSNESGDWFLIEIALVVSVTYAALGGDYLPAPDGGDRHSLTVRAANDAIRIRGALGYPGNLQFTEKGAATGLSSHLLEWRGSSSEWLDTTMIARHRFLARVEINPDAEGMA